MTLSSVARETSALSIAPQSLVLVATKAGLVAFDGSSAAWDPAFQVTPPPAGSLKPKDQLAFKWVIKNFGRRSAATIVEQFARLRDPEGHEVAGGPLAPGTNNWTTVAPDSAGTYTFSVTAIDVAGRESVPSQPVRIRIGTVAPRISPVLMMTLGLPVVVVGGFFMLLWLSPFTLARMERQSDHLLNAVSAVPGGAALKPILAVTLLPWFTRHPRSLDAWIEHHSTPQARAFEQTVATRVSGGYVPLPVRIGSPTEGEEIDTPTPQAVFRFMTSPRFTIEIVGGRHRQDHAGRADRQMGHHRRRSGLPTGPRRSSSTRRRPTLSLWSSGS